VTVEEYYKKKNAILEKYIGIKLVPNNQMVDIPVTRRVVTEMKKFVNFMSRRQHRMYTEKVLRASNCPYCALYSTEQTFFGCGECVMKAKGNHCKELGNSYGRCMSAIRSLVMGQKPLADELLELAKEFVKAIKHVLKRQDKRRE